MICNVKLEIRPFQLQMLVNMGYYLVFFQERKFLEGRIELFDSLSLFLRDHINVGEQPLSC